VLAATAEAGVPTNVRGGGSLALGRGGGGTRIDAEADLRWDNKAGFLEGGGSAGFSWEGPAERWQYDARASLLLGPTWGDASRRRTLGLFGAVAASGENGVLSGQAAEQLRVDIGAGFDLLRLGNDAEEPSDGPPRGSFAVSIFITATRLAISLESSDLDPDWLGYQQQITSDTSGWIFRAVGRGEVWLTSWMSIVLAVDAFGWPGGVVSGVDLHGALSFELGCPWVLLEPTVSFTKVEATPLMIGVAGQATRVNFGGSVWQASLPLTFHYESGWQ
jgi:hypothetical protein